MLGMEGKTSEYLVKEEMQREMMRRAERRIWSFEERLERWEREAN